MDKIEMVYKKIYSFFKCDEEATSYKKTVKRLIIKFLLASIVFFSIRVIPQVGDEGWDSLIRLAWLLVSVYFGLYACVINPIVELLSVSENKENRRGIEGGKHLQMEIRSIIRMCQDEKQVDFEVKKYGGNVHIGAHADYYGNAVYGRDYYIDSKHTSSLEEFESLLYQMNAFDRLTVVAINREPAESYMARYHYLNSKGWYSDSKKDVIINTPEEMDQYLRNNCSTNPLFSREMEFKADKVLESYGFKVKKRETSVLGTSIKDNNAGISNEALHDEDDLEYEYNLENE